MYPRTLQQKKNRSTRTLGVMLLVCVFFVTSVVTPEFERDAQTGQVSVTRSLNVALADTAGANYPSASGDCTEVDYAGGTISWTNPGNAFSSNDVDASISLNTGEVSEYLYCSNFGFSIPAGATIDGITVEAEVAAGTTNRLSSNSVVLTTDGTTATLSSQDKAITTRYDTTDTFQTHGGIADTWGETYSAGDINSSSFGVMYAAEKAAAFGGAIPGTVDSIRVTVTYTPVAEATFVSVSGTVYNDAGVTALTSEPSLKLVTSTSTPSVFSTTTSPSGTFTFENVPVTEPGMPISIFIDASSTLSALTVIPVASTTENLTGIDLYKDHVIFRSNGDQQLSAADLALYDNSDDEDIDIQASSTVDQLTVLNAQTAYVWPGSTFAAPASTTYSGSLQVEGSYEAGNWATFTGTGKTISGTTTGSSTLGNIMVSGSYTMSDTASTTDVWIRSGGSLTAPATMSVAGNFTNDGTFSDNNGTIFVQATAQTPDLSDVSYQRSTTTFRGFSFSGGLEFSPDGTRYFFVNAADDVVESYSMSTPYNVSTANLERTYSVLGQTSFPKSVAFTNDGLTMLVLQSSTISDSVIYEYHLESAYNTATTTFIRSLSVETNSSFATDLQVAASGDRLFITDETGGDLDIYRLNTPYSIESVTYEESVDVSAYGDPRGVHFTDNGLHMMIVSSSTQTDIHMYDLDSPWDATTATNTQSFDIFSNATSAVGIALNATGDRVFVHDSGANEVDEFLLPNSRAEFGGALVESSAFNHLTITGPVRFQAAASTTDLTITSDGILDAPTTTLSVAGDYLNSGSFDNNDGTVILSGASFQTATGSMTGGSEFYNLQITNTSGNGTTSRSVTFGSAVAATGTMTMTASSSAEFLAGATSTFATVDWQGTSASPIWLYSTDTGTQWNLVASGTIQYVNVRDSNACGSPGGGATSTFRGIDVANNTCWVFLQPPTVTTTAAPDFVYSVSAGVRGDITDTGSASSTGRGVVWGTEASLVGGDTATTSESGTFGAGEFTARLTGLSPETTYYFRAFASSSIGIEYGSIESFVTQASGPTWNATNWTQYDIITIDAANIDDDLSDFPVYVDLSDLSSTFWSTTPSASSTVGTDIRVTTNDGSPVELPRELVSASSTTQTGELHFKANNISSTTDTVFRIYYNGTTTGDYAPDETYGTHNVWTDYVVVWHMNEVEQSDSTGNLPRRNPEEGFTEPAGFDSDGNIVFDGNDDYTVSVVDEGSAANLGSYTSWSSFVFWDDPTGVTAGDAAVGNTASGWQGSVVNNMRRDTGAVNIRSGTDYISFTDGPTGAGRYLIQGSYDDTAGEMMLHVNGVLASSTNAGTAPEEDWNGFSVYRTVGSIYEARGAHQTFSDAYIRATYINLSTTTDFYATSSPDAPTPGELLLTNHPTGQVDNLFAYWNKTAEPFFAFTLATTTESVTVSELVLSPLGVSGITESNLSNVVLYVDVDEDGLYDSGSDTYVSTGTISISGSSGNITFADSFTVSATTSYLVIADTFSIGRGDSLLINLFASRITATGDTTEGEVVATGTVDPIQHQRLSSSGGSYRGGGSGSTGGGIGTTPPAGDGDVTGGTNNGGQLIGNDPDYRRPTTHTGTWTSAANAYDDTDGTYAQDTSGATTTYESHGFSIPGGNTIAGIAVQLEVSAVTGTGTIDVQLSWDGGSTFTSAKSTPTLTNTDSVVTLGSVSDRWGRSWSAGEFSNENFMVLVTGQPDGNTLQIDAIQVKVFHASSGGTPGGGGGGGGIGGGI